MKAIKQELKNNQVAECSITYKSKTPVKDRQKITGSKDTYNLLKAIYNEDTIEHHEFFYIILLSKANSVLGFCKISEGGLDATVVDTKIILQFALLSNASGIILTHNHPSGNMQPSKADTETTAKIVKAAKCLDIAVLDHIIVTIDQYYSFADNGLMY